MSYDTIVRGLSSSQRITLEWLHKRGYVTADIVVAYTTRSLLALHRRGMVELFRGVWRVSDDGREWLHNGAPLRGPVRPLRRRGSKSEGR